MVHRLFCRIHYVRCVGVDDYSIAAALCVTIALAVMNIFHIRYGTGLHISDLPLQDPMDALVPTLKYWYAYQIIYPLALFFVKLSFLALYWRIFGKSRSMRLSILVVGAVVVAYTVVVMFVNVGSSSGNWKPPCTLLTCTGFRVRRPCVPVMASNVSERMHEPSCGLFLHGGHQHRDGHRHSHPADSATAPTPDERPEAM